VFHDLTVISFAVDAQQKRVVLRAVDSRRDPSSVAVAEFIGVAAYQFSGDLLGTLLFAISESEPLELYRQHAATLQAAYRSHGGHAPWVAALADAEAFATRSRLRGFEISSSIGATGAVWCEDYREHSEQPAG
jgi:hypothetical protein